MWCRNAISEFFPQSFTSLYMTTCTSKTKIGTRSLVAWLPSLKKNYKKIRVLSKSIEYQNGHNCNLKDDVNSKSKFLLQRVIEFFSWRKSPATDKYSCLLTFWKQSKSCLLANKAERRAALAQMGLYPFSPE